MSRYIDADKINPMRCPQSIEEMRKWIDGQPTADVVEAPVRCKDCAYYIERQGCDRESQLSHYPPAYTVNFDPDDFCSYGERRVDE